MKITTTKGEHAGTIEECSAWQAEMQGAFAEIETDDGISVDVSDIDFDPDEMDRTIADVEAAIREAREEESSS